VLGPQDREFLRQEALRVDRSGAEKQMREEQAQYDRWELVTPEKRSKNGNTVFSVTLDCTLNTKSPNSCTSKVIQLSSRPENARHKSASRMDDMAATVLKRFPIGSIHSTLDTLLKRLPINVTHISFNIPTALAAAFALFIALHLYRIRGLPPRLTGPPRKGFLSGAIKGTPDLAVLYRDWERKYGAVYELPSTFGSRHLILGDPKGFAHFFANDTTTYYQPEFERVLTQSLVRFTCLLCFDTCSCWSH
jgi:hypothetical protein